MAFVEIGNLYYFMYIFIAFILTIITIKFLNHRSRKFQNGFIFFLIMLGFSIHFLKILIPPYHLVNPIWTKVTFENICATSALMFPVLFFVKNKTIKDYMVMVGVASGIITFIFPVDVTSAYFNGEILSSAQVDLYKNAFSLETIRFYLSHFLIFLPPFLMLHYKFHELSFKRAYRAPFMLFTIFIIIFINELIVTSLGWVPKEHLYDPQRRNPSFIFGVRGDLTGLGALIGVFVPFFLRTNPAGNGFFPVLWLLGPTLVYGGMIALTFMIIYDREETFKFFQKILKLSPKEVTQPNDNDKLT